jgi:cysteine-rich repeat protein
MKNGLAAFLFLAACTSSSNNTPACGDGVLDSGEQCDDGNTVSGDGCSATCETEGPPNVCGDGTVGGSEQCDDGNTTSGDGCSATCSFEFKTVATWTFRTTTSATPLPCPNGFTTAAVYSQALDAQGAPSGAPIIDLFNCSDGTGTTGFLDGSEYETWIAFTTQSGTSTYAQTVPANVHPPMRDTPAEYMADVYEDGGYFSWSWMLQGATSNNPLTCADVSGLQGVELVVTVSGGSQMFTDDMFTCEDGHGVTGVIPQGVYTVDPDAFSSAGKISEDATLTNKQISGPNKITDLGMITLRITGL